MVPTNGPLYVAYGDFFVDRGDRDAGLRWLAQADQASPTAAMLLTRAAVYVKLGMNDAALADLLAARQKEPGSLDVMLALGDLYRDLGDTEKAQAVYAAATKLSPGLAAGRVRLARLSR
jgi:tetratricopeptide (TPR) repeat protein